MVEIPRRRVLGLFGGGVAVSAGLVGYRRAMDPFRFRASVDFEPTTRRLVDGQPSAPETGALFAAVFEDLDDTGSAVNLYEIPDRIRRSIADTSNVAFWVVVGAAFAAEDTMEVETVSFSNSTVSLMVSPVSDPDTGTGSTDSDERDDSRFHYQFLAYTRTSSSWLEPTPDSAGVDWRTEPER